MSWNYIVQTDKKITSKNSFSFPLDNWKCITACVPHSFMYIYQSVLWHIKYSINFLWHSVCLYMQTSRMLLLLNKKALPFSFVDNYEFCRCPFLLMWFFHYISTHPLCILMGIPVWLAHLLMLLPSVAQSQFYVHPFFATETKQFTMNLQIPCTYSSLGF